MKQADPDPNDAAPAPSTRAGVSVYASALAAAGGRELEALARPGDRSALCVALYASPPYDLTVPALPVSRLAITLTASQVTGGLDGERAHSYRSPRHALFLTPADAAAHWRKASPSRHLSIYFHAGAFDGTEIENGRLDGRAAPTMNLRLHAIRPLVDELVAELDAPVAGPLATEAVDSLARLVLVHLARHQARSPDLRDPLTPAAMARLHAYVQAHLAERLLVADLAAVVGLSANRFAHAFTRRTGQAPHQYVLAQRLARAEQLLREGRLPLAAVAAACGFASQQHLTHTMRRRLGMTPGLLRNRLRGDADGAG